MSIRRSLELAAWLLVAGAAAAASEGGDAAQRERIERERAAVEVQARAGERECAQRFAVTSCQARVRDERRAALQHLDHQRALLDDAQRKQRAAARQARIGQRQEAQAREDEQRLPPAPTRRPVVQPAATNPDANTARSPPRRRSASAAQREAADASRRAEASRRRAEQAAAHRASVERRNRERDSQRAPLPLPAPSAPAH
jgi:colicin import membrane protein